MDVCWYEKESGWRPLWLCDCVVWFEDVSLSLVCTAFSCCLVSIFLIFLRVCNAQNVNDIFFILVLLDIHFLQNISVRLLCFINKTLVHHFVDYVHDKRPKIIQHFYYLVVLRLWIIETNSFFFHQIYNSVHKQLGFVRNLYMDWGQCWLNIRRYGFVAWIRRSALMERYIKKWQRNLLQIGWCLKLTQNYYMGDERWHKAALFKVKVCFRQQVVAKLSVLSLSEADLCACVKFRDSCGTERKKILSLVLHKSPSIPQ